MKLRWFRWLLRLSFSTERGAAAAYRGHAAVTSGRVRRQILQVRRDELAHRAELALLLEAHGLRPFPPFEWLFLAVGTTVALGCRVWSHWASAFGASLFEIGGVLEYRKLAALARELGHPEQAACLEHMGAQEAAHEAFFAELARNGGRRAELVRAPIPAGGGTKVLSSEVLEPGSALATGPRATP